MRTLPPLIFLSGLIGFLLHLKRNQNSLPLLSKNYLIKPPKLLLPPPFFPLSPHLLSSSYFGLFPFWGVESFLRALADVMPSAWIILSPFLHIVDPSFRTLFTWYIFRVPTLTTSPSKVNCSPHYIPTVSLSILLHFGHSKFHYMKYPYLFNCYPVYILFLTLC